MFKHVQTQMTQMTWQPMRHYIKIIKFTWKSQPIKMTWKNGRFIGQWPDHRVRCQGTRRTFNKGSPLKASEKHPSSEKQAIVVALQHLVGGQLVGKRIASDSSACIIILFRTTSLLNHVLPVCKAWWSLYLKFSFRPHPFNHHWTCMCTIRESVYCFVLQTVAVLVSSRYVTMLDPQQLR